MGIRIGYWQPAFAKRAIEIVDVAFVRLATVEPAEIILSVVSCVPILFDRLTGNSLTIHEEPRQSALKQDAIVAAASDDHCDTAGIAALDGEIVRRVIRVVDDWKTLDELDGMLCISSVDFNGPLAGGVFT